MTKTLNRRTLEQVSQAFKDGELGRATNVTGSTLKGDAIVLAKNRTTSNVATGAPVAITGFLASNPTYNVAQTLMVNRCASYSFGAASSSTAPEIIATALEPIKAGKIGRVKTSGFLLARCTISNASHTRVNARFESVASGGEFAIVARSQISNGKAICALARLNSSGATYRIGSNAPFADNPLTFNGTQFSYSSSAISIRRNIVPVVIGFSDDESGVIRIVTQDINTLY